MMGDSNLMNEWAGFRGAVGTLWSIEDSGGPLMAEIFHKKVLEYAAAACTSPPFSSCETTSIVWGLGTIYLCWCSRCIYKM
jgi:hypothetical protein